MNKTTEYINALLPRSEPSTSLANVSDILSVHEVLNSDNQHTTREDDTPLLSVKSRLEQCWPNSLKGQQLIQDDEGRTQLQAMPKAKRVSMFPEAWRTNSIGRFWDRLRGRELPQR